MKPAVSALGHRVVVIGLDCAPPALVFDRLAHRLPFLRGMRKRGVSGALRSTMPPITLPAWASMVSGKDPGELGIYGFRDRVRGERTLRTVTAEDVHVPRVWDVLGAEGRSSSVLFVPPTFPPRPAAHTELVSCLLAPADAAHRTHPEGLADELSQFDLRADVDAEDERTPERLLAALEAQVERHFDLAEHFVTARPSDFFMMVEMATDRLHHGLWPALDPDDPRHARFAAHQRRAEDLYVLLDSRIERLSERLGSDTTLLVVSDHGARSIVGGIYVNEVLRRAGLLVLREEPAAPVPLAAADVDWARTVAWAEGGYYARVFVHDAARFAGAPEVDRAEVLERLEKVFAAIADAKGKPIAHRIVRPDAAYRAVTGQAPDLAVYLGDLDFRSLGAVGTSSIHASPDEVDGDLGRGGCNHDWNGIFLAVGPGITPRRLEGASLLDVGPTVLARLGLRAPADWQGRDLLAGPSA